MLSMKHDSSNTDPEAWHCGPGVTLGVQERVLFYYSHPTELDPSPLLGGWSAKELQAFSKKKDSVGVFIKGHPYY